MSSKSIITISAKSGDAGDPNAHMFHDKNITRKQFRESVDWISEYTHFSSYNHNFDGKKH